MPDVLAIVSKAIFEKEAGGRGPGSVWAVDRYRSENKNLQPLAGGGRLFLVTVRPPADTLWLVAVLHAPSFQAKEWVAQANTVPITDLDSLKPRIRFTSGKGIQADKGALAMSLQTPRVLMPSAAQRIYNHATRAARPAGPVNVTKHDDGGPLPCLCGRCYAQTAGRVEVSGMAFVRVKTEAQGKQLHFWMPEELASQKDEVAKSVRALFVQRLEARV